MSVWGYDDVLSAQRRKRELDAMSLDEADVLPMAQFRIVARSEKIDPDKFDEQFKAFKKTWKKLHVGGNCIDPLDPGFHNEPLWVVYGHITFPTIICVKLRQHPTGGLCMWGYSEYRNEPGFRTMGNRLDLWMKHESITMCRFYTSINQALNYLEEILTPKAGA